MKIVIVMDGGLIQDIFIEAPELQPKPKILVCDYDTESGMGKELMESPAGDMGYHREFDPDFEEGLVDAWFSRWEKHLLAPKKEEEEDG
jgi:hypothetical protein